MKVRIVSTDGIPHNVQIQEQQTGEVIKGLVAAFIHPFNANSRAITGEITVLVTSVDIVMDADVHLQCPYCNHSFPVETEDPIHTTVVKQDAESKVNAQVWETQDSQVFLEDHLSKATWSYGEKSGEFMRDAVQAAAKEMQEKLEKAYMDVQKDPAKRIVGIDIETEVEIVDENMKKVPTKQLTRGELIAIEGAREEAKRMQQARESDDAPVIHFDPHH